MQPIVEIKKPCREILEDRKPGEKGNYCKSCQVIVVDFTGMKPNEISDYVMNHAVTCGTFYRKDVSTGSIADRLISYLQKRKLKLLSFVVLALTVLTSCRTRLTGAMSYGYSDSLRTLDPTEQTGDTLKNTPGNEVTPIKN